MKASALICIALLSAACSSHQVRHPANTTVNDQGKEVKTYTCLEIYQMDAGRDAKSRDRYNDKIHRVRLTDNLDFYPVNAAGAAAGVAATVAFGPVGVIFAVMPTAYDVYKNSATKEEKALRLTDETNHHFENFVSKLQKKVSSKITADEVQEIIEDGFNSGLYCQHLPKLASHKAIQKQVTKVLKERYPSVEK